MQNAFRSTTARIVQAVAITSLACPTASLASPAEEDQTAQVGAIGDLNVFVGIRTWANRWDVPATTTLIDPQTSLLRTKTRTELSDTKITTMPVLAIRYKDWLGSLTYFADTSYSTNNVLTKKVKRSEYDINLGYYILPSLLISLGYKHAEFDRAADTPDSGYKIDGLLLGATATAPLSAKWSVYGNLAFGIARERTDAPLPNGDRNFDGEYRLSEVGLAYRFFQGAETGLVRSASLSIGYRAQNFTVESFPEFISSPAAPGTPIAVFKDDVSSDTSGFVLSLVASF